MEQAAEIFFSAACQESARITAIQPVEDRLKNPVLQRHFPPHRFSSQNEQKSFILISRYFFTPL